MSALGRKQTCDNDSKSLGVQHYRFNNFNCHRYIASASLTILPNISSSRSSGGISFGLVHIHWNVSGSTSVNLKMIPLMDVAVFLSKLPGREMNCTKKAVVSEWHCKNGKFYMTVVEPLPHDLPLLVEFAVELKRPHQFNDLDPSRTDLDPPIELDKFR